jgi:hypothetical protein
MLNRKEVELRVSAYDEHLQLKDNVPDILNGLNILDHVEVDLVKAYGAHKQFGETKGEGDGSWH